MVMGIFVFFVGGPMETAYCIYTYMHIILTKLDECRCPERMFFAFKMISKGNVSLSIFSFVFSLIT